MLTWAIVTILRGVNVSGDAGCTLGIAMVADVLIVVAVCWTVIQIHS